MKFGDGIPYRMCNRCIMDTSDPEINFDENGFCNHCRRYYSEVPKAVPPPEKAKFILDDTVRIIKEEGKDKPYDCIIGLSGGVDSSTVAYHVKKLGLRPLAVHLDNGWDAELAVKNIENIVNRLKFDLFTHVIDWEEFKDIQLAFLWSSIPNAEVPSDHAISALLFHSAKKNKVQTIIGGSNMVTEFIMPASWMCDNLDLRLLQSVHKKFGKKHLRTFPTLSLFDRVYSFMLGNMRYFYLLNYIPYNKKEAEDILKKEICFKPYGAKHYESVYTRFFQGYILPVKYGIDKRKAHLSTLICSGQITREWALEEMKKDPYPPELLKEDKDYVMKKLELSEKDFTAIISMPPKSHNDYPNTQFLKMLMGKVSRRVPKILKRKLRS